MADKKYSESPAMKPSVMEILLLKKNKIEMGDVLSVLEQKGIEAVFENDLILVNENGINITIMHVKTPVLNHEAETAIKYSMGWLEKYQKEIPHVAHLIVNVSCGNIIQERNLQSLIVYTFINSNAVAAVYNPSCKLLIPPTNYVESYGNSLELGVNASPMVWLNIATASQDDKSFGYVYGLHAYGKSNYEIVASDAPVEELLNFLVNIAAYLMEFDTNIKAGETIGFSSDQKLAISPSNNAFLGRGGVIIHY